MTDFDSDITNRITVEKMMATLTPEEQAILRLRFEKELTFDQIGEIIGREFRNPPERLTGGTVRYHYKRIFEELRSKFPQE